MNHSNDTTFAAAEIYGLQHLDRDFTCFRADQRMGGKPEPRASVG
jgi:hypothetical protein